VTEQGKGGVAFFASRQGGAQFVAEVKPALIKKNNGLQREGFKGKEEIRGRGGGEKKRRQKREFLENEKRFSREKGLSFQAKEDTVSRLKIQHPGDHVRGGLPQPSRR